MKNLQATRMSKERELQLEAVAAKACKAVCEGDVFQSGSRRSLEVALAPFSLSIVRYRQLGMLWEHKRPTLRQEMALFNDFSLAVSLIFGNLPAGGFGS